MCSFVYHSSAFVFVSINKTLHEYKISVRFHILSFMSIFGLECSNNTRPIDDKIYFHCILFLWSLYEIIFAMKIEALLKKSKITYTFGINFVCSQVHSINIVGTDILRFSLFYITSWNVRLLFAWKISKRFWMNICSPFVENKSI